MKIFLILGLTLLLSALAGAAQLTEKAFKGRSKETQGQLARRDILDQAAQKVSEDLIKQIIGEDKFRRNRSAIQAKIIKSSARYIPSVKSGDLTAVPANGENTAGYEMSVVLKVNIDDLQKMLLAQGLFYASDASPIILPMVRLVDRVHNSVHGWWFDSGTGARTYLHRVQRNLESSLQNSFWKINFYSLEPQAQRLVYELPEDLKQLRIDHTVWIPQAQKWNAQILVEGEMLISESKEVSNAYHISLKLTALQVGNGRMIADVLRQVDTDRGPFEVVVDRKLKEVLDSTTTDLGTQVLEAWQKGTLGASVYRMTLAGKLPIQLQPQFKEMMKGKVREIKNIRERVISKEEIIYEIDSSQNPQDLVSKMSPLEFLNYQVIFQSADQDEVKLRLERKTN